MQRHSHGGDVYTTEYRLDFSTNLNPLGMPKGVQIAARRGVELSDRYPDVRCAALRRAIARREGVLEESIICGNGAAELIFLLAQAEKPKKALLTAPGFAEYERALPPGCEIVCYPLKEENGFAVGEDFLDYLNDSVDLVFFCNPNNPTGVFTGRTLLTKMIEACAAHKIRLALDVCFMDFLDDPGETDFSERLQEWPHLFLLKAFTKTYSMAGLRLGYGLCADPSLLARMEEIRQPWSVSVPAQMAGEAALAETQYVQRARELVRRERAWLKSKMQKLGLTVYDGSANFLFFRGPKELAARCAAEGILIRDCSNYRGLKEGYFRVAVRTHTENRELIRVFAKIFGEA